MEQGFVQKKLLYKFDKKIELLFQSILNMQNMSMSDKEMLDESEQGDKKSLRLMRRQGILQQIQQLQYLNQKYRTALISAQRDQIFNQGIIKKAEQQIVQMRTQVERQSVLLEEQLKCKRNKQQYNALAESIKGGYETLSKQNEKMEMISRQIEEMERRYNKQVGEYERRERCLRLALSALRCVMESEEMGEGGSGGVFGVGNGGGMSNSNNSNGLLYVGYGNGNGNELKVNDGSVGSSGGVRNEGNASSRSREEGEQLEGGEIVY